jgi:hypothetical protein
LAALSLNQTTGAKSPGIEPRTMLEWCGGRDPISDLVSKVITIALSDKTPIDRLPELSSP